MSTKILIVDDDMKLRRMLEAYLQEQGFQARAVSGGTEMDRYLAREHVDMLVLDLMMPEENGLSICKRLRAAGNQIPILFLSAKGDDVDRIVGLEVGADDYLAKPFNPRELVARIRTILRRQQKKPGVAPEEKATVIAFGHYRFELDTRRLLKQGRPLALTSNEYAILKVLCQHPHQPLSRDKLMNLAKGRDLDVFDRSIDVQVSRLRKIIEEDASNPRYIQTVWGVGYVFVPDAD